MKDVQCHAHFGGIALKNHAFSFSILSDHDIVFVETSSRAIRHMPAHRKILLWKHANFDNIRLKISDWTRDLISSNTTFTPVGNIASTITGLPP